jgi:hypothetical protein
LDRFRRLARSRARHGSREIDLFEAWFGDILDELFGKPG